MAELVSRTPRHRRRLYPRMPLWRRDARQGRADQPWSLMLLGTVAAGIIAFSLTVSVIDDPISSVGEFIAEAQFVIGLAPEAGNTKELLVPRAGARIVQTTVPMLRGLTRGEAEATAAAAELRVVFDEDFSETIAEGEVFKQVPAAGSMHDTSDPVQATISRGRPQAAVPNVVGLPAIDARMRLAASGFQVVEVSTFSQHVPANVVLRQEPIADRVINRRSAVALHVSRGIETASTPHLAGRSEDDARRAVEVSGLVLGRVTYKEIGSVPNGVVESQDPSPGALIERGSEISLTVVRIGEISVPAVLGLEPGVATRELLDRGLFIGSLIRVPTVGIDEPRVVEQRPGAGARVPRGFSLRLTVAIPSEGIAEPPRG